MDITAVRPGARQVVVIASAPTVSAWRLQLDSQPNTRIFSETDFLAALHAIIHDLPDVIALDPMFAATARGAALVARVKADPGLRRTVVRALVGDGLDPRPATPGDPEGTMPILSQPLDSCGTRRAPRYEMQSGIDAKVNGTASGLVNLSITGSQMVAPIRLRPAEGIRLTLSDDRADLRLAGAVAWVHLEIAAGSSRQRYRFGVEFHDADFQTLQQFCMRHREES